ncbi:hypothetical protein PAXINDRAFT_170621 [Paxillus involutus ATCC 200175]|uniref:Uncharacterized protein n=1 Tax=Paxillus involutus ATCC 200175 TaxID=664439 RepID=A0A0C9U1M4_PAXIN|nr:hypothetical protein PAXINDRAFT_170621 [Paxillus involutus ATCC 200175]
MSVSILTLESSSFRPCTILRELSVRKCCTIDDHIVSRCDAFPTWFYYSERIVDRQHDTHWPAMIKATDFKGKRKASSEAQGQSPAPKKW